MVICYTSLSGFCEVNGLKLLEPFLDASPSKQFARP
jgi:hypothetical protein